MNDTVGNKLINNNTVLNKIMVGAHNDWCLLQSPTIGFFSHFYSWALLFYHLL